MQNNAPRMREPGMLRNAPGAGYMAYTASSAQTMQQQGPQPEVENGNIILYRTHNFFLRTAYRPGQRPNPLRKPTGHTTVMPRVMQRTVAVPGAVTVVAALAGGTLAGILGALLAIPTAAGLLLIYDEVLVPRQRQQ